jgi:hypothetical protein
MIRCKASLCLVLALCGCYSIGQSSREGPLQGEVLLFGPLSKSAKTLSVVAVPSLKTRAVAPIPPPSDFGYQLQWTPDARRGVFLTGAARKEAIWVLSLRSGTMYRLGKGRGYFHLDLSPNGKHLLALRDRFGAQPTETLCLLDIDGRSERVIARHVHTAAWVGSGKSIVFSRLMKGDRPAEPAEYARTGSPGVTRLFFEAPLPGKVRSISPSRVDQLLGRSYRAALRTWRSLHESEYYDAPGRVFLPSPKADKVLISAPSSSQIHGGEDVVPTHAWIESAPPEYRQVHSSGRVTSIRPRLAQFAPMGWSRDGRWLYGSAESQLVAIDVATGAIRSLSLPRDQMVIAFLGKG